MKKMKLLVNLLLVGTLLAMFMTGCNNEFAEQEYHSNEKISQAEDRYAKVDSLFNMVDGGCTLTVGEFDGRQSLWTNFYMEEEEMEIELSLTLSAGQAKIVHVDGEGNVITLLECTPETCTQEAVSKTISLKKGENRLKIVGYDCRDIDFKLMFVGQD